MDATKQSLLRRIEADREVLIEFLRGFIRCKSPNPPGDTREVAAAVLAGLYPTWRACQIAPAAQLKTQ